MKEREDALKGFFLVAQRSMTFPETTLCRLAVFKEENNRLLVCSGRYVAFGKERITILVLPMEARVSLLLAHKVHDANHEEIAVKKSEVVQKSGGKLCNLQKSKSKEVQADHE